MSIFLAIHDCKVNMFASFQRLPRVVTLRAYLLPHFFLPKSSNLWQTESKPQLGLQGYLAKTWWAHGLWDQSIPRRKVWHA